MTDELKKQASLCSKCGKCLATCPTYSIEHKEQVSPRGRIFLSEHLPPLKKKIPGEIKKAIESCMFCLKCSSVCPNEVDIKKSIIPARSSIISQNGRSFSEALIMKLFVRHRHALSLLASTIGVQEKLFRVAHIYGAYRKLLQLAFGISSDRLLPKFPVKHFYTGKKQIVTSPGNTKSVIYFPGCAANLSLTSIAEATLSMLLRSGSDVLLPRLQCCGMPAYSSGDISLAEILARQNMAKLRATGCRTIITSCGSCGAMLGKTYRDLLGTETTDFEVMDIMTYLESNNVQCGPNPLDLRVSYHDPCHLKRSMAVYEEPRRLLKRIPGIDYIEMEEPDACCGSGGTASLKFYSLSKKIKQEKIHRYQRTKANILATGCPACVINIQDGFHENSISDNILHPVQLLNLTFKG